MSKLYEVYAEYKCAAKLEKQIISFSSVISFIHSGIPIFCLRFFRYWISHIKHVFLFEVFEFFAILI